MYTPTYLLTFQQLVDIMEKSDNNLASCAIERMMVVIEDETGIFPDWSDYAPNWVIDQVFNRCNL